MVEASWAFRLLFFAVGFLRDTANRSWYSNVGRLEWQGRSVETETRQA